MFLLYSLAFLLWFMSLLSSLLLTSSTQALTVVCFVPLTERGSIDLDDGRFGESIGSDKFVVGGMESDNNYTDLSGDTLRSP
jgi:hypothetical protein